MASYSAMRGEVKRRSLSVTALIVLLAGCTSNEQPIPLDQPATMLNVSDPRAGKQLVKGFFNDAGPGRWTGRTFSAILKPPPTAARKGAILVLRFGIPGPSIDRLRTIAVSASVNGVALAPEEYAKAGEFLYIREVPAASFRNGNATVDFALDKALPPGATEHRELGVVVNTVGFEAK
jgi:hypothetical protein